MFYVVTSVVFMSLCWAEKNFNILATVTFFCHISLLYSSLFFHSVGNWSSGWIDLYRCGDCRSDRSVYSCVYTHLHTWKHWHKGAHHHFCIPFMGLLISGLIIMKLDHFTWHENLHMQYDYTHICTQSDTRPSLASLKPVPSESQSSERPLIPPTLPSSISATPNFSLLRSLSD